MRITSLNQLSFPDHVLNDMKKGFLVQVHDQRVSILVNKLSLYQSGFFELNYGAGNFNTVSSDSKTAVRRVLDEHFVQIYYFDSLASFAEAILGNDWKLSTEN